MQPQASFNLTPVFCKRLLEFYRIINSIVHNENGCEIKVSLSDYGKGKNRLIICDNGQGTNEQKVKALNAKIKNTYLPEHGLGIRVVKQVARRYGFKVMFSSVEGESFLSEIVF